MLHRLHPSVRSRILATWMVVSASLLAGCATLPSTLQTAETTPTRELRVSAGTSMAVSTRFIASVADLATAAADRASEAEAAGRPFTPDEKRDLLQSALGVLLFQPAPVFELDARLGLHERVDVGFKWAGPMLRLDGKVMLLRDPAGTNVAALLGYTYHTGIGASIVSGIYGLFESLDLVGYSRHDLDAALIVSGPMQSTVTPYGSLRYLAARPTAELRFQDQAEASETDLSTWMHNVGVVGGASIGNETVRFHLELGVSYLHLRPKLLGEEVNLSGLIFLPALGLSIQTG